MQLAYSPTLSKGRASFIDLFGGLHKQTATTTTVDSAGGGGVRKRHCDDTTSKNICGESQGDSTPSGVYSDLKVNWMTVGWRMGKEGRKGVPQ